MRKIRVSLIIAAIISIASAMSAWAEIIDSYIYLDNNIGATVRVEVERQELPGGGYRYTYRVYVYPGLTPNSVLSNPPNPRYIGLLPVPGNNLPDVPGQQQHINRQLDPNQNGIGIWDDRADRIRVENQLQ